MVDPMDKMTAEIALKEEICNRFAELQVSSGMNKSAFAAALGLTPSQFTNIQNYRNLPSHATIKKAIDLWGLSADYFYRGTLPPAVPSNPEIAAKLRRGAARRQMRA